MFLIRARRANGPIGKTGFSAVFPLRGLLVQDGLSRFRDEFVSTTALVGILGGLTLAPSSGWANPQDGRVVGGQAVIAQPDARGTAVTQLSERAASDWRRF